MGNKDISGKYLIDRDPTGWARWLLGDPTLTVTEILSPEFQFVARRGDSLLRVSGVEGPFLMLVELQLHYDNEMPARLQNYAAMARQKYSLPVFIMVVYLTEPGSGTIIATHYHSEFMGQVAHQDFAVLKLWELDARQTLQETIPVGLLPYVPLMDGADEAIVRECARRIRSEVDHEELETILALFAMIKLDAALVEKIVRWHVTILEKSPIYQEILTKGAALGLEQGIEQGLEQGLEQGVRRSIARVLTRRFGKLLSAPYVTRLEELPLPILETLLDEALVSPDLTAFAEALETFKD